MAVVIAAISVVWKVLTTIYTIGHVIYDYIIKPIKDLTDIINDIRNLVNEYQRWIQNQLDILMDITGITPFVELVDAIASLKDIVDGIVKGNGQMTGRAIAELYKAMTGTARDIVHFVTESIKPAFENIAAVKEDLETLRRDTFKQWENDINEMVHFVEEQNRTLVETIRDEIKEESERLKAGIRGEVDKIELGMDIRMYMFKDLADFVGKYITTLEI